MTRIEKINERNDNRSHEQIDETNRNLRWRLASQQDAEALVSLVNEAYRGESGRKGWTTEADLIGGQRVDRKAILADLERSGSVILLAHRGSELIGCVHLEREDLIYDRACYLGMLTVRPEKQAGGVGSYLLKTAEAFARENWGIRRMHMTVISVRKELIAWYERRGYRLAKETRPFPYGNERFGVPFEAGLYFEVLQKDI